MASLRKKPGSAYAVGMEDWPVLAAALALSSSDLDRGHGLLRRRNRGLDFRPHRDLSKRAAEIPRSGRNLGAFPAFVVV
jgi:hypothetical protein